MNNPRDDINNAIKDLEIMIYDLKSLRKYIIQSTELTTNDKKQRIYNIDNAIHDLQIQIKDLKKKSVQYGMGYRKRIIKKKPVKRYY